MRIEHVAMYVNDLEAARDFFVRYLDGRSDGGYHNTTTGFRSYFVTFEDGPRLEVMTKPRMDDASRASIGRGTRTSLSLSEARKRSTR